MSEKICSHCGRQNPADMSFCLNCGQSLATSGVSNFPPDSAPTVFVSPGARQNVPPQQQNVSPGFQTPFQPLTPNVPPPAKKSRAGFYLAIFGGIGLILLLVIGGIGGLIAMNWDKITEEDNNNNKRPVNVNVASPTPIPTRANRNSSTTNSVPLKDSSSTDDHTPFNSSSSSSGAPNATFERMWIDYNITQDGQNGMRIHAKFTVNNMKGVDSYLALYFETRDGKRLQDKNKKFYSVDGTVAAYQLLKPGYDVTTYDDLDIFMPYDELDLSRGKYALRIDADVIRKEGGLIQHLTFYDFDYTY